MRKNHQSKCHHYQKTNYAQFLCGRFINTFFGQHNQKSTCRHNWKYLFGLKIIYYILKNVQSYTDASTLYRVIYIFLNITIFMVSNNCLFVSFEVLIIRKSTRLELRKFDKLKKKSFYNLEMILTELRVTKWLTEPGSSFTSYIHRYYKEYGMGDPCVV